MAFMRFNAETNRQSAMTVTDIEILIASEVRHSIDEYINTASIDQKLNVLIMSEISRYKHQQLRNAVHLSEQLDKSIKDISAIVAPQVPGLLAMNEPQTFSRK